MSTRLTDYALLMGHIWRCLDCRELIMSRPDIYWIGFKLSDDQKDAIRHLTDESFQTLMRLADETGLTTHELEEAVDHPRARLRHWGVIKYDYRSRDR